MQADQDMIFLIFFVTFSQSIEKNRRFVLNSEKKARLSLVSTAIMDWTETGLNNNNWMMERLRKNVSLLK
jgi:hypothetical protein